MSGIFAYFAPGLDKRELASLVSLGLRAMPDRGDELCLVDCTAGTLGAVTHRWQEDLSGGSRGACGEVKVVADATLYYKEDLVRKLAQAGRRPASLGSADLIAAAVAAWGARAVEHLEGDFAFVAWDPDHREVIAARDHFGMRTLFYSLNAEGGLAVASSPSAIVAAGAAPGDLNLGWLGELCCALIARGDETVFKKVSCLRQAQRLVWRSGASAVAVSHYWDLPHFSEEGAPGRAPFLEAAEELRSLLVDAVRERLAPRGVTAVTLSGGRDSSSVYACGRHVAGEAVQPVSLSYPPGDIGREDEIILEILAASGGRPSFVATREIPFFGDFLSYSRLRPDAFGHPYVNFHHALGERAVAMGARVALNGLGGDALFRTGPSYLSDLLFSRAPWRSLSEARALGYRVPSRAFLRAVLLPKLSPGFRRALHTASAWRRFPDPLLGPLMPWLQQDFVREVLDPRRAEWDVYQFHGQRHGQDREHHWMLMGAFPGRIVAEYYRVFLEKGIEQRSPLNDVRLAHFAASRPRPERVQGGDHKLLLRQAMRGWLPESVVGVRPRRTGHNRDYVLWSLDQEARTVARALNGNLALERLGIVVATELLGLLERPNSGLVERWFGGLAFSVQVEGWLRSWLERASLAT
jgi:asparagine synthase (glutamine-hydrolysing)